MNLAKGAILTTVAVAFAGTASAGTWYAEDVPDWRGTDGADYYHWDDFTAANGYVDGPNMPNNEMFPSGNAMLFNFAEGAIIAGSGNLYAMGGSLNIHTYAYTDADALAVTLNLATVGTLIDYTSMMLVWTDGTEEGDSGMLFGSESVNFSQEIPNMGDSVNVSWNWDLSGIGADIRSIGLMYESEGSHISLDMASLDILTAVPAPGALALLGLAALSSRRRRE
ncbi:MAG: hypothetical protein MK077_07980 [Phycisphaerales bacterium]|nr:hypothetical protein [Phycisphaerales bacterium]